MSQFLQSWKEQSADKSQVLSLSFFKQWQGALDIGDLQEDLNKICFERGKLWFLLFKPSQGRGEVT